MTHYVCSDLHGMLPFYKTIKDFIKPEDKVFYLGDAGDRGPEPWETIKVILNDPQFIYIKGNHEDMLCKALEGYLKGKTDWRSLALLSHNGGRRTYEQAIEEPDIEEIYQKLESLPTLKEYINDSGERIFLSHAGFTPWKKDFCDDDIIQKPTAYDLIWDRDHFFDEWRADDCVDCIIIHGHTPVPYLLEDIDPACQMGEIEPGALWYDNGRKCCIDCGAVFTGYCSLLNLDTWEEEVFYTDPYM